MANKWADGTSRDSTVEQVNQQKENKSSNIADNLEALVKKKKAHNKANKDKAGISDYKEMPKVKIGKSAGQKAVDSKARDAAYEAETKMGAGMASNAELEAPYRKSKEAKEVSKAANKKAANKLKSDADAAKAKAEKELGKSVPDQINEMIAGKRK